MAVIIAYEEVLPKYVNIGFTRCKVSLYIPAPLLKVTGPQTGNVPPCLMDPPRVDDSLTKQGQQARAA